jgi:hypothetical protein
MSGYQGQTPRCWLKNGVGAMVPNARCTSEIISQGEGQEDEYGASFAHETAFCR